VRESRAGWIVAALALAGGAALALGVRTPQQTTAEIQQAAAETKRDVETLKTRVGEHDVTLASQGKDLQYIKDAVDELRGHRGRRGP
jgi:hypothetical protein